MQGGFFFQAEDGIRDWSVTGVQTCALPISSQTTSTATCGWRASIAAIVRAASAREPVASITTTSGRSEERRVGKERRRRGPREHDHQTDQWDEQIKAHQDNEHRVAAQRPDA